jgi:hypothetical protein
LYEQIVDDPHGMVERTASLILGEQRLHFLSQGCIASESFGQKCVTLAIRDVEGNVVDSRNP